ncbi:hypothetical protein BJF77_18425 [Kocuria sp. CNJ-770]|uniref:DUF4440 domain-containing protein n=1 Tax=Kocuria oceani TaxID=988827 RepID=A0ABV9TQ35_9MICC|nr:MULTISPECIES: hypothetical protein [Kocuria]OLT13104.1 hypothetical protein BJF77_18425 [Kocuria sp. CNJ-770]
MTRHSQLALTLALCALPLAACAPDVAERTSEQTTATATSTPSPTATTPGEGTFLDPTDVDRTDVEATAEAAALLIHSWDTVTDRTQTAAAIRAKPLMSEEWAANQIEPERNGNQAAWLKPSEHQAYSAPSITPAVGDVSRDVANDKVIRAYDLTWRWISRDGQEIEATGRRQVVIYLEKHSGQWEVVGHQSSDPN